MTPSKVSGLSARCSEMICASVVVPMAPGIFSMLSALSWSVVAIIMPSRANAIFTAWFISGDMLLTMSVSDSSTGRNISRSFFPSGQSVLSPLYILTSLLVVMARNATARGDDEYEWRAGILACLRSLGAFGRFQVAAADRQINGAG